MAALTRVRALCRDISIYLILASCTTIPTSVKAAIEVTFDGSKSSDPEDIDYLSLDTTK
jgi:hypothetical protein